MRPLVALMFVAACGGDGGGGGGGDDTPPIDSAPGASIVETACGDEVATVESLSNRFEPATTTIQQGQVVQFSTEPLGSDHNIIPNSPNATGLEVGQGQVKCFRFTEVGTFTFRCFFHSFVGTIIVN